MVNSTEFCKQNFSTTNLFTLRHDFLQMASRQRPVIVVGKESYGDLRKALFQSPETSGIKQFIV